MSVYWNRIYLINVKRIEWRIIAFTFHTIWYSYIPGTIVVVFLSTIVRFDKIPVVSKNWTGTVLYSQMKTINDKTDQFVPGNSWESAATSRNDTTCAFVIIFYHEASLTTVRQPRQPNEETKIVTRTIPWTWAKLSRSLIQETEDSNNEEFLGQRKLEAIRNRSAKYQSYWIVSNSSEENYADVGLHNYSASDDENFDTDTRDKTIMSTLLPDSFVSWFYPQCEVGHFSNCSFSSTCNFSRIAADLIDRQDMYNSLGIPTSVPAPVIIGLFWAFSSQLQQRVIM